MQNLLFSILLSLFLLEQIFNYILGSFPYRYGIVVKKIALPNAKHVFAIDQRRMVSLATKVNKARSEMYLRYRYRFGTIGPILFIGQITLNNGGTTYIRTGVFSSILLLYIVLHSILAVKETFFSILNFGCIIGAIMIFYLMLIRNYQKLINI
jgi:hypothetical protein